MRILLDHCVDIRFGKLLRNHEVSHTKALGMERLSNGKLLKAAEDAGFEIFITVDKNLRFQQNIAARKLTIITLASLFTGLDDIGPLAPQVEALLNGGVTPGTEHSIRPD